MFKEKCYILVNPANNKYWTGRFWDTPFSRDIEDAELFYSVEHIERLLTSNEDSDKTKREILDEIAIFEIKTVFKQQDMTGFNEKIYNNIVESLKRTLSKYKGMTVDEFKEQITQDIISSNGFISRPLPKIEVEQCGDKYMVSFEYNKK